MKYGSNESDVVRVHDYIYSLNGWPFVRHFLEVRVEMLRDVFGRDRVTIDEYFNEAVVHIGEFDTYEEYRKEEQSILRKVFELFNILNAYDEHWKTYADINTWLKDKKLDHVIAWRESERLARNEAAERAKQCKS